MKKYALAILFTQAPFGSSASREGLDALLAASAFCDEDQILIAFLADGVFNVIADQHPEHILQKDHLATFKLLELYELNQCLVCQEDVAERQLTHANWTLSQLQFVPRQQLLAALAQAEKLLTF